MASVSFLLLCWVLLMLSVVYDKCLIFIVILGVVNAKCPILITLRVVRCLEHYFNCYAECSYADCHYADCHCAECHLCCVAF